MVPRTLAIRAVPASPLDVARTVTDALGARALTPEVFGTPEDFAPIADVIPIDRIITRTREQARSLLGYGSRARTIPVRRESKRERARLALLFPLTEDLPRRPETRAGCADVPRPCPFVSCKHHLYLDVSPKTGTIKMNFPDLEPSDLPADRSCSLDVADAGGETLDGVARRMNLTRERVRQLEQRALDEIRADDGGELDELRR